MRREEAIPVCTYKLIRIGDKLFRMACFFLKKKTIVRPQGVKIPSPLEKEKREKENSETANKLRRLACGSG